MMQNCKFQFSVQKLHVLNEKRVLLIAEAKLQSTSACSPLVQPTVPGSMMLLKQLGARASAWGLLLHFPLCVLMLWWGLILDTPCRWKNWIQQEALCTSSQRPPLCRCLGLYWGEPNAWQVHSVRRLFLDTGPVKGIISSYSNVFRSVSDTQIQGKTRDVFKVSRSLLGRMIHGNCGQESLVHNSSLYVHMVDKNPEPVSDAPQAACHSLREQL